MSYQIIITINDLDTSQITEVSRYSDDRSWPWMLEAFISALNGAGFGLSPDCELVNPYGCELPQDYAADPRCCMGDEYEGTD